MRANVSIIMPVYNGEKYLEETIKYILSSTYKEIELIIVDDGSTDNSLSICKKMADEDNRIRILTQENSGVANARNRGIEAAEGEFLCFADQDDIIDPKMYATLLNDLKNNNAQIAICNIATFTDGITNEQRLIKNSELLDKHGTDMLRLWLLIDYNMEKEPDNVINKTVWNGMFSTELVRKNRIKFRRIVRNEDDWIFLIDSLKFAESVYLEDACLYKWRIHKNQTTWKKKYVPDLFEKRKEHREFVQSHFNDLTLTKQERERYDARWIGRSLFLCISNAEIALRNGELDNYKEVKKIIDDIFLYYKEKNLKIDRKAVIHEMRAYGLKNTIIVFLALLKQYRAAITAAAFA